MLQLCPFVIEIPDSRSSVGSVDHYTLRFVIEMYGEIGDCVWSAFSTLMYRHFLQIQDSFLSLKALVKGLLTGPVPHDVRVKTLLYSERKELI